MKAELSDLCNMISKLDPPTNCMHQPSPFQQQYQAPPQARPSTYAPQPTTANPKNYCWTHGWCYHLDKKCKFKTAGHLDEATKTTAWVETIINANDRSGKI
eukprot:493904-Ditylum_brightwellii.AAC.2